MSVLIEQFDLARRSAASSESQLRLFEPRYNIAPTQSVWAVRNSPADDQREAVQLHWGLIPPWAKEAAIGNRMINARAETVAEKPSFRSALKRQRCLVLADGYYEWQKTGGRTKQPYYFHREGDQAFAFAGLWERWRDKSADDSNDASTIESCTIITTTPNRLAATVHDRMPVILDEADYDLWLDRDEQDAERLRPLLAPLADEDFLIAEPVSTFVNKPTSDGPACIEPL